MKTSLIALCLTLCAATVHAQEATAPSAAPAVASPAASSAPTLSRFELATGVEAREPVGTAESFSAGTKVYAFLDVANPGEATELVVTFEREGGVRSPGVTLNVPSGKRYRTHAYYSFTSKPGVYKCIITTKDGAVVSEKSFEVK